MRAAVEAGLLIDAHRRALAELGANDDLRDLFLAFLEYAPAIDADFRSPASSTWSGES